MAAKRVPSYRLLYEKLRGADVFRETVSSLGRYLAEPTKANHQQLIVPLEALMVSGPLGDTALRDGDWLTHLFLVFEESKRETLENQKYWLKRLEERNKINDAIQSYMKELVDAAQRLNEKVRSSDPDEDKDNLTVEVLIRKVAQSRLEEEGVLEIIDAQIQPLNKAELQEQIHLWEKYQAIIQEKQDSDLDESLAPYYPLLTQLVEDVRVHFSMGDEEDEGK